MHRTLLLADDSPTIQRVIELTFADQEFDVVCVSDGQAAVDRIVADPPDVVLADVAMPERTGYDVCAFVKQSAELAHIPVVLLTGAFEPIDQTRASEVRCDAVLAKPFEPQAVVEQVQALVATEEVAPPEPVSAEEPASEAVIAAPVSELAAAQSEHEAAQPAEMDAESVDEYLDRLDAAFATLGSASGVEAETGRAAEETEPAEPAEYAEDTKDAGGPEDLEEAVEAVADAAPEPVVEPKEIVAEVAAEPVVEPKEIVAEVTEPAVEQAEERLAEVAAESVASEPLVQGPAPAVHDLLPATDLTPPEPGGAALADAFESLLAEERGERRPADVEPAVSSTSPSTALDEAALDRLATEVLGRITDRLPAPSDPNAGPSDQVVDEIARRVADRISHQVVRETVTEVVLTVADRLVREEIERIKGDAT